MPKTEKEKKYIPATRFIPCYRCVFMGKTGTTVKGEPIAWCHLQQLVVGPEIGCRDAQPNTKQE